LDLRYSAIKEFIVDSKIDAVVGRGGPLEPMEGGTYRINKAMLNTYRSGVFANHASNLGALLANKIAETNDVPSFIVDPVSTDEFNDVARISGVPGILRKSRSHALNIKYCYREACKQLSIENGNFIIAHLGGGFSISAVNDGAIVDTNDALLGMGPFSINRAGATPLAGILDLVFKNGLSEKEIIELLTRNSGLKGYLGTESFMAVEKLVKNGDQKAIIIYKALVYQVIKEIGGLYATFNGNVMGIVITGGLAHSKMFVKDLNEQLVFIENFIVFPGSFELEALADGALNVLNGIVQEKTYSKEPS